MQEFQHMVWDYYTRHRQEMPWRFSDDPYAILISEVMLQQTQVSRVLEVFPRFMQRFPTIHSLAEALFAEVLGVWQGMGYNRRALWLQEAARSIELRYQGAVPDNLEELKSLKGIGHNTAAAILVYAFDQPVVFIETNIRTVFLHHFFADRNDLVEDKELMPLVAGAMDHTRPKAWCYALMDYGTFLKQRGNKAHVRSAQYRKQSTFEGSVRQLRGEILRVLQPLRAMTRDALYSSIAQERAKIDQALAGLVRDKLVSEDGGILKI